MPGNEAQHLFAVGLPGQGDEEVAGFEFKEAGQQFGVIHVGAVGGVAVAAGAGVHPDALPFGG